MITNETSAFRHLIEAFFSLRPIHVIRLAARIVASAFRSYRHSCPPLCLPYGDVGCCALGVPTASPPMPLCPDQVLSCLID